jgi:GTP-binding protein
VFSLYLDVLDSPFVYASARAGISSLDPDTMGEDMKPLLDTILSHIPAPTSPVEKSFKMLVSSCEANDYLGKLAVGKVDQGTVKVNETLHIVNYHTPDKHKTFKITKKL